MANPNKAKPTDSDVSQDEDILPEYNRVDRLRVSKQREVLRQQKLRQQQQASKNQEENFFEEKNQEKEFEEPE